MCEFCTRENMCESVLDIYYSEEFRVKYMVYQVNHYQKNQNEYVCNPGLSLLAAFLLLLLLLCTIHIYFVIFCI